MKEIILLMLIFITPYIKAQDIASFSGPTAVLAGNAIQYSVTFSNYLMNDTELIFNCTHGKFDSPSGPTYIKKTASIGSNFFTIVVHWNNIEVSGATIKVYKESNPGQVKEIVVSIKKNGGETGGTGYINGAEILYSGKTATFGFTPENDKNRIYWQYDSNTFTKVNTNEQYPKNLILQAKNLSGIKTTKITAFEGKEGVNNYRYSEFNTLVIGSPIIRTKSANVVCQNDLITYDLEYLEYFPNATITWQSSTNMTLVSGQGTPNATFRVSGNEFGTAKATVIYDGVSYQLENSQVWVGKPLTPIIRGNERLEEYQSQLAYFFDGEITGASEFEWRIEGNASMLDVSKGNVITIPSETNILPMSIRTQSIGLGRWGEFNLFLKTKNICGTTPEAFVHGRIKGGKPTPEEMSDFSLSSLKTYTSDDVASANIRIYSLPTGSLVYKENKAINFDIQNTTLNAGIYILEKTDKEGNVTREKVMKIK